MQEGVPMHWHRGATIVALLLAWALLAVWQWQEYQAECEAAREAERRQAESVMNALVGGVQSHRRLGLFFEEPLQSLLDQLSKSRDVLAVAVSSADRRLSLTAGKGDLLNLSAALETGSSWEQAGFRYTVAFQLSPDMPPRPGGPGPDSMGPEGRDPDGMGPRRMGPDGMDQPKSPSSKENPPPRNNSAEPRRDGMDAPDINDVLGRRGGRRGNGDRNDDRRFGPPNWRPLGISGRCFTVLLLDRTRTDMQIAHFAWLRIAVVAAGGAVMLSVVLAWRATMRLADAHGRAQLLEIEARHLRDLSQAATGLAHETRNPLGLIRGWTQRWMQTMPDGPQQLQAQAVIEECDRVTVRINQFLAFARPCKPKVAGTQPAEVVAELTALLNPDLDAKQVKLVSTIEPSTPTISADREMFRQALFNLIQNAVEFSPAGEKVEVADRIGPDGLRRIEVADRGPGVPADEADHLFTPYHTTRSNGTGLGLAIVRRIALAHGWQSGYTPRPGGGAIFWLDGIRG
jgi:signal transduction histidine kinase